MTVLVRTETLLVLLSCLLAAPLSAGEVRLPRSACTLPAAIAASCPECAAMGFTPCGSPTVQWGTRFAPNAFLGTPRRAYLPTFAMSGDDFRALARTTAYDELLTTLKERFAAIRLVVIDDAFAAARVLPRPDHVAVTFPAQLHACVHDSDRPWGCCVDCKNECCEKALGSPTIVLTWRDAEETLTYHHNHTIGVSWLERRGNGHRTRYACLTEAKGHLRSSQAP